MNGGDYELQVYLGNESVAKLKLLRDEIQWVYIESWRDKGFKLSPHLPLSEEIPTANVQRFLRNLLPEGLGFEELLFNLQLSRSNTFGLIRALGNDLPGALIIRPAEHSQTEKNSIREIAESELIQRLDTKEQAGLVIWDKKPRLSVAGIQDKINVIINSNGQMGFAEGDLCSTHILKFERKKQQHLVLNEYITMQLAKRCKIETAEVYLKHFGPHRALLVSRFDRKKISDYKVTRQHVIDGCQVLNLPPEYKYERNFGSGRDVANIREGASLPRLFQIASICLNPAETKLKLLDWVLFNCLIFNSDAHGKNISFFINKNGIRLTPFYDLVNVAMYPDYAQEMAMALGDEFDSHGIHAYQLADFADSCTISRRLLVSRLKDISKRILSYEIENNEELSNEEKAYSKSYMQMVYERAEYFLEQADLIQGMTL